MEKPTLPLQAVSRILIIINIIFAAVYFSWWLNLSHVGNLPLYILLFIGEIYHLFMAFTFWMTIWPGKLKEKPNILSSFPEPKVAVFITVAGEPKEVIKQTVQAAKGMDYPNFEVFILNDGYVAKKGNWNEAEEIANELEVNCLTRRTPRGAKAGNINNALVLTKSELIAVFDADMVPHKDFLKKTTSFFIDEKIAFVQTPQYYQNFKLNEVTRGSWSQQSFFFGPVLIGKEKSNSVFICGTNVVIRRKALEEVGGMAEDNIAEDFLTSLRIHEKGWLSYYLPEILAEGYAPFNLFAYYKQQFRWARGSLEVAFKYNPLFDKKLSWGQRFQYLASSLYYFSGLITLIDMLIPLFFLFFGIEAVNATTSSFAIYFIPFIFLNLLVLYIASEGELTFLAFSFSYSVWFLQLSAIKSLLLNEKSSFTITPKTAEKGNFVFLTIPHLFYSLLGIGGIFVALNRQSLSPSVATNIAWMFFNIIMFLPFIKASYGQRTS